MSKVAAGLGADLHAKLIDAVGQAVIATDADRRIVLWNRFAEQLYGWSAAEVVGKSITEMMGVDLAAAETAFAPLERGEEWSGEMVVRRKGGQTFPADISVSPILDRQGQCVGAVGVSSDLTSRKEREQHYENLFKSMSEGFALCEAIRDGEGKLVDYLILEINPALQAMLGVGPEVIGTKFSDGGWRGTRWLATCDKALRTGEPVAFESHNRNTDRWHEIRLGRLPPDRLTQFFFDITERKQAQARQARLFDELNHRVKNNLAMVSSLLELQARGAGGAARGHLMKAVDRLASVSAVHESLYGGHRTEDVDFGAYLNDLCGRLTESLLDGDRVTIKVDAAAEVVSIDNAAPLGMIVNELVTNAAKYAYPDERAGVIHVHFGRDPQGLLLSIFDDGVGLPDAPTGAPGSLGMKVVKSLVQQVGGVLTVSGGTGARFDIRLPAGEG